MTRHVKVKGHGGLVRDTQTKAIVNTNKAEYERYVKQRDVARKRQSQVDQHEEDLNILKADIAEIKQLLLAVLKK